ncbi:hypothetical protein L7F22_028260 [Adiantum nelumboides]|nr:hypothetical protein [Adiantum nelumboides]
MANKLAALVCDTRMLLLIGVLVFVVVQMRLYSAHSEYADRIASAVEAENHCTSQMRLFIDQISQQMGRIVSLEDEKRFLEDKNEQLSSLLQQLERKAVSSTEKSYEEHFAAVVIMACNRPDYLERTIKSVLQYYDAVASKFHLFISQDGNNADVRSKALSFSQFRYMQHLDVEPVRVERPGEMFAYYKIASHYRWALSHLFDELKFKRVIILEDDMEIAPDFFEYFEATGKLLENDRSLMAVSSWNDNGQRQFVQDPEALHRSDFFPGLGWMLTRDIWQELSPKWPRAYWDDWLRLNETRKGRQFIRPEICRTYNFGEHGSSMGQFFRQYLEPIKLNDVPVKWRTMDLSYLSEKSYNGLLYDLVSKAVPLSGADVAAKTYNIDGDARIEYADQGAFERLARQFGVFHEWKDGVPRTAYKGVVMFRWQTMRRVFLVNGTSLSQLMGS